MRPKHFATFFIITIALCVNVYQTAFAAVDLVYFIANEQNGNVLLEWETATELDNAGFIVTRSDSPTTPVTEYTEISDFIPAEGSGVIGAYYWFLDQNVIDGETYYYVLQSIATDSSIEYTSPISITVGQPTNTPTATPTATSSPTNTPTGTLTPSTSTPTRTPTRPRTPTRTSTRTPSPGNTSTSVPPTNTPTAFTETPTITLTPSITPLPTLLEAPEIILQLPTANTPLPSLAVNTFTPLPPMTSVQTSELPNQRLVFAIGAICLLVFVWAAIAISVFIYLQKRNA